MEDGFLQPVAGDLPHFVGDLGRVLVRAESTADQKPLVGVEDIAEGTLEVAPFDDFVDQGASPRSWRRTWARRDWSSRRSIAGGSATFPIWTAWRNWLRFPPTRERSRASTELTEGTGGGSFAPRAVLRTKVRSGRWTWSASSRSSSISVAESLTSSRRLRT